MSFYQDLFTFNVIDIVTGEPNIQCRQLYNMNVYKSKTYSYLTILVNAIIVITPKAIVNGSVFISKGIFRVMI